MSQSEAFQVIADITHTHNLNFKDLVHYLYCLKVFEQPELILCTNPDNIFDNQYKKREWYRETSDMWKPRYLPDGTPLTEEGSIQARDDILDILVHKGVLFYFIDSYSSSKNILYNTSSVPVIQSWQKIVSEGPKGVANIIGLATYADETAETAEYTPNQNSPLGRKLSSNFLYLFRALDLGNQKTFNAEHLRQSCHPLQIEAYDRAIRFLNESGAFKSLKSKRILY